MNEIKIESEHRSPAARYAPAALASALGAANMAHAQEDRLEPCHDSLREYQRRVESIAHQAMPGKVAVWVTVIPSFTPEWSVGLSSENGDHFATHVVFDQSLWESSWVKTGPHTMKNDPAVGSARAIARSTRISADLFEALRSEWSRSIAAASSSNRLGLDGVSYQFRLPGQCARAWSPSAGTRNAKLVELVDALRHLANQEKKSPPAQGEEQVFRMLREIPAL